MLRTKSALVAFAFLALGILLGAAGTATLAWGGGQIISIPADTYCNADDSLCLEFVSDDPYTGTPQPTTTPSPTDAPTATLEPTPTPEIELTPSATPWPTNTPVPWESCTLTAYYNINVREVPGGTRLGYVLVGDTVNPDAYYVWSDLTYYKVWWIDTGIAQWAWIADFFTESGNCEALPEEYPFESGPSVVLAGTHNLAGSAVSGYAQSFDLCKAVTGATGVCETSKRLNPDMVLVARTLHTDYGMIDCPQQWNYESPETWWVHVRDYLPDGFDFYEIQNECPPPPQGWAYWAEWSIEIAKLVERDKGGALLAFSFPLGNPYISSTGQSDEITAISSYIAWADAQCRAGGVCHGIALHQSPYCENCPGLNRVNTEWIAGRHLKWRQIVLDAVGVDILTSPMPIIITEGGLSDGYGDANWNAPYTCEMVADAFNTTVRVYGEQGIIDGLAWWNFGTGGASWHSDNACLPLIVAGMQ